MKELVLVIGPALPGSIDALCTARAADHSGKAETASGQALPERLIAHWDGWEAPDGEIALSARLRDELTTIRAEHMAWARRGAHARWRTRDAAASALRRKTLPVVVFAAV